MIPIGNLVNEDLLSQEIVKGFFNEIAFERFDAKVTWNGF